MSLQEKEWSPEWSEPSRETLQGYTRARFISEEQIEQILEAISEGVPKTKACKDAGTSNLQLTRRARKDPEVAKRVEVALAEGKTAYEEEIRAEVYFQAFLHKNYKALRDLAFIHLPEFAPLHTQQFKIGNLDGESFKMAALKQLGPVSDEDLKVLIDIFERQQAELPPAGE